MIEYTELEDRELLDLAGSADTEAAFELIRRQRLGRSVRLYSGHRNGPDDEGVVPLALGLVDDITPTIIVGLAHRGFGFTRDQVLTWVLGMADRTSLAVAAFRDRGCEDIDQAMREQATPGFGSTFEANSERQLIGCYFDPPDQMCWVPGIEGAVAFISGMLSACVELNWELNIGDDELKRLKPYVRR